MRRKRVRIWDFSTPPRGFFLVLSALLFAAGLLAGFFLSGRLVLPEDTALQLRQDRPATLLCFLQVFWSHFRWPLFAAVLSLSGLGFFLLYPLVFFRGLLVGFSFTVLFVSPVRLAVLLRFFMVTLLTCSPVLLISACGMKRALAELGRSGSGGGSVPAISLPLLLLLSFVLSLLCTFAELWLLPGFASHIQPFT